MIKLFLLLSLALNIFASERIIALSPSVNEIIFALGEGDKIVGNTTYCKYPQASLNIPKVGGYFNPSLEKIVSLNPTLVIMQPNNYKLSQKLQALGIKTKIVKIDTLSNIKASILEIAEMLEKKERAQTIISNIDIELEKLKNITSGKKILVVMGHNTSLVSRIFVAGQIL
jgi:iron complex transport system substrate-binding protein